MNTLRGRLLEKAIINFETGCWEWEGIRSAHGYGRIRAGDGRKQMVHRVSYEMIYGPIPDGLRLDHLCRVRHCLNPAHLEAVTNRVNVLRGEGVTALNAAKTRCDKGHEFTPENLYLEQGARRCKTCKRTSNQERMRRVRAARRTEMVGAS